MHRQEAGCKATLKMSDHRLLAARMESAACEQLAAAQPRGAGRTKAVVGHLLGALVAVWLAVLAGVHVFGLLLCVALCLVPAQVRTVLAGGGARLGGWRSSAAGCELPCSQAVSCCGLLLPMPVHCLLQEAANKLESPGLRHSLVESVQSLGLHQAASSPALSALHLHKRPAARAGAAPIHLQGTHTAQLAASHGP